LSFHKELDIAEPLCDEIHHQLKKWKCYLKRVGKMS